MTEQHANFLRRDSRSSINARTYKRYQFLREHFKLPKKDAWRIARELEKWWNRG